MIQNKRYLWEQFLFQKCYRIPWFEIQKYTALTLNESLGVADYSKNNHMV